MRNDGFGASGAGPWNEVLLTIIWSAILTIAGRAMGDRSWFEFRCGRVRCRLSVRVTEVEQIGGECQSTFSLRHFKYQKDDINTKQTCKDKN